VLCNDAAPGAGGTEGALVAAALGAGIDVDGLRRDAPRSHEVPFDSVRREMLTRHRVPGGQLEVVKGAPEVLLPRLTGALAAVAVVDRWTAEAHRVLAVTAGEPGATRLVGLFALADPVRPDAREAILAARAAGIRTVMITGDHPGTAAAVARATGVVAPGDDVQDPDTVLRSVYARTDPAGKLDIVAAWQDAGHIVAMTGDGVNDAPALRAADVGVAMGRRGTEVAKDAADLVLTEDNLSAVVSAVAEGRRVFDNVRRFVRYGLAGGLAEMIVMLIGPFLGFPLALLPGQILWVNLVTHGLPGVAFGSEQPEPDVLQRPPRPPKEGILTRRGYLEVLVLGTVVATGCLGLAVWASAYDRPWQTMLFATLVSAQLGIAITTRSDRMPVWRMSPAGNPFLYLAVGLSLAATLAAIYAPGLPELLHNTPLTLGELALAFAVGAVPSVVVEVTKAIRSRPSRTSRQAERP
jgi:Ca2+-transporting ATPase